MIDEPTSGNKSHDSAENKDQGHNKTPPPPHKPSTYKEKAEKYKKAASAYFNICRERVLDADSWSWKWFGWGIRWLGKAFWSTSFWTAAATVTIAVATIVYTHYARSQWREMTRATYAACINTQISQRQLLEIQRTNSLSQAMATSSMMQTAAAVDTQRASVHLVPRFPTLEESSVSGPNFQLVYAIKNDGRAVAKNGSMGFKAILVENDQPFKVTDKVVPVVIQAFYLPGGESIPGKPEIGRPVTAYMPVVDKNGNEVSNASGPLEKVLSNSAIIAAIGSTEYSDFSGTHKARFCIPLWEMRPGTSRSGTGKNEATCLKYNYQEDESIFTTKIPPINAQEPLPRMKCPEPPN
jgi:hypothetical protein